jgi:hypothetical protein
MSSDDGSEVFIPSDEEIKKAVDELAPTIDLEDISLKKFARLVCRKLGVGVEDLMPKKAFLKECMEKELEKQNEDDDDEDEEESLPDETEIEDAAKKLSKKVDFGKTSFTEFMKRLADDLDVEDLTPAESIIKSVYDKATEKDDFPSDKKIVRTAKKLAASSRIDLEDVTKSKFLKSLQKRMGGIDLSSKKDLVYDTLKECKREQYEGTQSFRLSQLSVGNTTKPSRSSTKKTVDDSCWESMTESTTERAADLMMTPMFNSQIKDSENMIVENPRKSTELEHGRNIPEAATLTWTDGFFDDDTEDLVAVFDHDKKAMLAYLMKVAILTRILPWTITFLSLAIILSFAVIDMRTSFQECEAVEGSSFYNDFDDVAYNDSGYDYDYDSGYDYETGYDSCSDYESELRVYQIIRAVFLVFILLQGLLALYGYYRIAKSNIDALHCAVVRDGIRFVRDDHIECRFGVVAAFHIFDICILVSQKSETVSTNRVIP